MRTRKAKAVVLTLVGVVLLFVLYRAMHPRGRSAELVKVERAVSSAGAKAKRETLFEQGEQPDDRPRFTPPGVVRYRWWATIRNTGSDRFKGSIRVLFYPDVALNPKRYNELGHSNVGGLFGLRLSESEQVDCGELLVSEGVSAVTIQLLDNKGDIIDQVGHGVNHNRIAGNVKQNAERLVQTYLEAVRANRQDWTPVTAIGLTSNPKGIELRLGKDKEVAIRQIEGLIKLLDDPNLFKANGLTAVFIRLCAPEILNSLLSGEMAIEMAIELGDGVGSIQDSVFAFIRLDPLARAIRRLGVTCQDRGVHLILELPKPTLVLLEYTRDLIQSKMPTTNMLLKVTHEEALERLYRQIYSIIEEGFGIAECAIDPNDFGGRSSPEYQSSVKVLHSYFGTEHFWVDKVDQEKSFDRVTTVQEMEHILQHRKHGGVLLIVEGVAKLRSILNSAARASDAQTTQRMKQVTPEEVERVESRDFATLTGLEQLIQRVSIKELPLQIREPIVGEISPQWYSWQIAMKPDPKGAVFLPIQIRDYSRRTTARYWVSAKIRYHLICEPFPSTPPPQDITVRRTEQDAKAGKVKVLSKSLGIELSKPLGMPYSVWDVSIRLEPREGLFAHPHYRPRALVLHPGHSRQVVTKRSPASVTLGKRRIRVFVDDADDLRGEIEGELYYFSDFGQFVHENIQIRPLRSEVNCLLDISGE